MNELYEQAKALDESDPLRRFRDEFHIPSDNKNEKEIYFCGNSLGLQPIATQVILDEEMQKWRDQGVKGHFSGERPWMPFHKFLMKGLSHVVGANENEVVPMNSLTANLHLMMVSFYRPTAKKHKIMIESHAFPSDHFAVESQIKFHGFDLKESLILVEPAPGEEVIRPEKIIQLIELHGDSLSLVLLPGVQYYTGQVFDMERITSAAHDVGAKVGFDLAHAAGNIELKLHDWKVDFAVWCHYKYLNSGPGAVGGCFVHENHFNDASLPRFTGWWGHDQETRFQMINEFRPMKSVEAWQLSNPPIVSLACIKASLDVFESAGGMKEIRKKSVLQFSFFDSMLETYLSDHIETITPKDPKQRGCQLSLKLKSLSLDGQNVFNAIEKRGITCDWRHPNIIRVAPTPLYSSFSDIYNFTMILKEVIDDFSR